jgi:hypothetical protein
VRELLLNVDVSSACAVPIDPRDKKHVKAADE